MEKEIWRPIKGYEGYYQVSNLGNVRSVDRVVIRSNGRKYSRKSQIRKIRKDVGGYLICDLCKNSKYKTIAVHRLVAQAFIPNPDNLPEINHKDEVKTNNCVFVNKDGSVDLDKSNLEWCDSKYNKNYGTAIQRRAEKLSIPVLQLDINTGRVISEYPSAREAERQLNISQGSISKCCNGKQKTAGGFKWKYKE